MTDQAQPMSARSDTPANPPGMPFADAVDAERVGWYEVVGLVRELTPEECLMPGYYRRPPDGEGLDGAVAHSGRDDPRHERALRPSRRGSGEKRRGYGPGGQWAEGRHSSQYGPDDEFGDRSIRYGIPVRRRSVVG